jgi:2-C-methyl-D-erythritol 4-phosphate cytidylyltransferase
MPAIDTLKRVNDLGLIQGTLDRAGIWQAQTPQVFRTELVLQAHRKARTEGYSGTDDASLVEWMGHPVSMVQGSRYNIKITTPEDLRVAEAIYRLQETA